MAYAPPSALRPMTPLERRVADLTHRFAADFLMMLRSVPPEDLHDGVATRDGAPQKPTKRGRLDDVIHAHICEVLASVSGNKSAAARILGINRRTLNRMFKRGEL